MAESVSKISSKVCYISQHRETIDLFANLQNKIFLILVLGIASYGTTHPGVCLGPCQISLIVLFAKISAESSMIYVLQRPQYVSIVTLFHKIFSFEKVQENCKYVINIRNDHKSISCRGLQILLPFLVF